MRRDAGDQPHCPTRTSAWSRSALPDARMPPSLRPGGEAPPRALDAETCRAGAGFTHTDGGRGRRARPPSSRRRLGLEQPARQWHEPRARRRAAGAGDLVRLVFLALGRRRHSGLGDQLLDQPVQLGEVGLPDETAHHAAALVDQQRGRRAADAARSVRRSRRCCRSPRRRAVAASARSPPPRPVRHCIATASVSKPRAKRSCVATMAGISCTHTAQLVAQKLSTTLPGHCAVEALLPSSSVWETCGTGCGAPGRSGSNRRPGRLPRPAAARTRWRDTFIGRSAHAAQAVLAGLVIVPGLAMMSPLAWALALSETDAAAGVRATAGEERHFGGRPAQPRRRLFSQPQGAHPAARLPRGCQASCCARPARASASTNWSRR